MKKFERKEILYCDICGRISSIPLTECPICRKEGCYICTSQLYDVYHTHICVNCLKNKQINDCYMELWRNKWGKDRDRAIEKLRGVPNK